MADFFLKKGDTAEPLVRILEDQLGAVTLGGAVIRFQMRAADSPTTKVDALAVADLNVTGKVSYDWQSADVDTAGLFFGEFKVTFAGGKVATFPNGEDYIEIEIGAGVDDLP